MKRVIVINGRAGSGKDYAGDFLAKKYDIPVYGISSALRIIAKQRNIEPNRETLIEIGKEVAIKQGDDFLAKTIIQNTQEDFFIITGMRQIGQVIYTKNNTEAYFYESSQIKKYVMRDFYEIRSFYEAMRNFLKKKNSMNEGYKMYESA